MEKDFIEKMKETLLVQKQELVDNLIANNSDFQNIVDGLTGKDAVDVATDDVDRKMLEALGAKDLNKLKLIESALSRIEQNKYGLCIKCGVKIPQERLEAIPSALLCISCKTEDERKNR